jgi:uncharacterized protein
MNWYPSEMMRRLSATIRYESITLACLLLTACLAAQSPSSQRPLSRDEFIKHLVSAAVERTHHQVRYDPAYVRIPYPAGDVPSGTAVCTDEIIRIYRGVGIDLQKEVHEDMEKNFAAYPSHRVWGRNRTDTNIDHRRVPNLAVFFARKGESVRLDASEYRPGDLVTWDLGGGVPHIGMVVDRKGASGQNMVVHNIGQGPRMEDVLFVWKVTGHFRYYGK